MSSKALEKTNLFEILFTGKGWGSGFGADFTITNASNEIINSWKVEFDSFHNVSSLWNAKFTKTQNDDGSYHYVITNPSWQSKLAPGASVSFGFNATSAPNMPVNEAVDPTDFRNIFINGGLKSADSTEKNPTHNCVLKFD